MSASNIKFTPRKSEERGGANHGWLKTFHTFSFANYQDEAFEQYGPLRVINEDRVIPTQGFGTHAHREFEIFSYILDGQLTHRDSLHNTEILKRGDLQMTSTGTGIRHSEFNDNPKEGVHFLQIWAMPHTRGLKPNYYTRHVSDEEKRDKLVRIVAPVGAEGVKDEREAAGPAPVHSWLSMSASLLSPKASVSHTVSRPFNPSAKTQAKRVYLHLVQSSGYNTRASYTHADAAKVKVSAKGKDIEGVVLGEGDGMFIDGGVEGDVVEIESVGGREAEFVLFEMD
ncbi:hypothetical protein FFLO_00356 [Filobasidium floriforme]|uniref:Pirin N-terminal domain-containing protein n=1 Tax=Filobasidium floriforme TaxID=5210 RepID=A0A8K0JTB5_9TREE|nr:RmlC-like cupin domain-containing protein [Filobasidium floriforme]KAG7575366.1 hypothetical protein FFLO_00356 [Filobasidium floriforme]KAH8089545.1 RmlC-like cupin domain-containing protein [Filobasidium floriforme]